MKIGNTLSNICNNGLAATYNNEMYFVNVYRGEDLYKVCGKMYSNLTSDKVKNLNIINDTIYYTTLLGELKAIDISGENEKVILEGPIDCVVVSEDYIYYINVLDNYSIYRYSLINKEIKKISSDICDKISVNKDYIYYIKCSENLDWYGSGDIYRVSIEDKEIEEVLDMKTNNIILDGEYIYFTAEEFNYKLCRVNVYTNKVEDIVTNMVGTFNVYKNFIYYSNLSDEGKLYKVNLDNMISAKISDDIPENINIANDYIYFANGAYGYPYRLYRMKLNGEEKQMI